MTRAKSNQILPLRILGLFISGERHLESGSEAGDWGQTCEASQLVWMLMTEVQTAEEASLLTFAL